MDSSNLPSLIFFLSFCLFILIFFLIRGIILWYYKIDERIGLMKENNNLIRELLGFLKDSPSENT